MHPRETAPIALVAAVFSLVCFQMFVRAAGHHAQLSHAQVSSGLTICLVGVTVGLLLVLCVSAFQDAGSRVVRSLGALGLVLGCALLFALVGRHAPRADAAAPPAREPANSHWAVAARAVPLLARNPSR
ncbi:MAG TPA: hypothetical protein VER12_03770 [Polyangiaceae bacterium]|nr:hypothetical protein [Polyangiaceae bacterium]